MNILLLTVFSVQACMYKMYKSSVHVFSVQAYMYKMYKSVILFGVLLTVCITLFIIYLCAICAALFIQSDSSLMMCLIYFHFCIQLEIHKEHVHSREESDYRQLSSQVSRH